MITVREYLALRGRNPWEEWFESLDAPQHAPAPLSDKKLSDSSNTGSSAPAAPQGEKPPSLNGR